MTTTNKNGLVTDFVREAIREKASRELNVLNQRAEAFEAIERAKDTLHKTSSELTMAATSIAAVVTDTTAVSKLKKLRKAVDDALVLATEIADVMGVNAQREALNASRQAILEALKGAGLDPKIVLSEGGDAQ